MDVIWIFKEDHQKIRALLDRLDQVTDSPDELRHVANELEKECSHMIDLEGNYLIPEVEGEFPHSDVVVKTATAGHAAIKRHLRGLHDALATTGAKRLVKTSFPVESETAFGNAARHVITSTRSHLNFMDEGFLPKVREHLPTLQREDLGQVILDIKEEYGSGHIS